MHPKLALPAVWLSLALAAPLFAGTPAILGTEAMRSYVGNFNRHDHTHFGQAISNETTADWMAANVPLFDCPDKDIEEIYHFRWWTFRKHIKKTADGFVITEFLPKVRWSGKHNTISCPVGHHFRKGGSPRSYSFWAADAVLQRAFALGNFDQAIDLLPDLIANYTEWEKARLEPDGLFWQTDGQDGGEVSVAGRDHRGEGKRPTINSYQYGDAMTIAVIAETAGKPEIAAQYRQKAQGLRKLVLEKLWDDTAKFFKVLPRGDGAAPVDVRELYGYTPWYFGIPPHGNLGILRTKLTPPR